jgi:hypothetical protein
VHFLSTSQSDFAVMVDSTGSRLVLDLIQAFDRVLLQNLDSASWPRILKVLLDVLPFVGTDSK